MLQLQFWTTMSGQHVQTLKWKSWCFNSEVTLGTKYYRGDQELVPSLRGWGSGDASGQWVEVEKLGVCGHLGCHCPTPQSWFTAPFMNKAPTRHTSLAGEISSSLVQATHILPVHFCFLISVMSYFLPEDHSLLGPTQRRNFFYMFFLLSKPLFQRHINAGFIISVLR